MDFRGRECSNTIVPVRDERKTDGSPNMQAVDNKRQTLLQQSYWPNKGVPATSSMCGLNAELGVPLNENDAPSSAVVVKLTK